MKHRASILGLVLALALVASDALAHGSGSGGAGSGGAAGGAAGGAGAAGGSGAGGASAGDAGSGSGASASGGPNTNPAGAWQSPSFDVPVAASPVTDPRLQGNSFGAPSSGRSPITCPDLDRRLDQTRC
jgi:hypothetical protein